MAGKHDQRTSGHTGGSRSTPRIPVVAIGTSAGGVKALQTFFRGLPAETGAAFIVVVHLDPTVRSELAEILSSHSRMSVTQVTANAALKTDCVYVIPPDRQLHITDNEIAAVAFDEPRGQRAPIDHLFRSLADQHGDGFAIVLTGADSDGAQGVKSIKAAGGIILVQHPEDAEYPSMPCSAIDTEAADFVLPLHEIPGRLMELLKAKQQVSAQKVDEEEQLRRVLAHLRVRTGHDFSHYKRSTVVRRITRRMQVARKQTLDEYVAYLRESADEAQALLADLLISVTTFFRDPRAFDVMASVAIPRLFEGKEAGGTIRVWVPGCATGEEAYSIAILLLEEASRHEIRPEIQVFASDMDARALSVGREGRYPLTIEDDLNEDRLRRFFSRDGDQYRVKRDLRDIVLFANHSLLKDPPFSRLDLISCRNLLIYMERELQQQVLVTLHYGLNSNGFLLLGSSEGADHPDNLFHVVDRDARLYQSTGRAPDKFLNLPRFAPTALPQEASVPLPISGRGSQIVHREALEDQAPPSILVDDALRALHLSETAGRYLLPSGGPVTTDITDLVRQELRFELRTALHRAFERGQPILSPAAMVRFNGDIRRVYVQVKPLGDAEQDTKPKRAIVFFIEGQGESQAVAEASDTVGPQIADETNRQLKQELEMAQAQLRTTREESEAASEELRAANEELQSINEEYRSTAEELETSKEELQSINEELQTVNTELKLKLETVSRANSDLQNLTTATDFATLFLDPGLRIKRFTPRVAELFSVTPSDIGRPITDFAHQLDYDGIPADCHRVLQDLDPIEREVRSRQGDWYLVRFRPYRTVDDKIDGVVATFLNVTERRKMEDALRTSGDRLRQETLLVELSRAPIFVWEFDGDRIVQWNRGSEELYGYTRDEAVGRTKLELLKTTFPGSSFEALKDALLKDGVWKGELHQQTKDGRNLVVESQIALVEIGRGRFVLESTLDVTQSKALEARQRLLLRELTHRVKNTLTVVQSIVQQTWRTSGTSDAFIDKIGGRIAALANAHNLLVESDWGGADLRRLIESQVEPYAGAGRLHISGDAVSLPPDVATPFGLVLHELATNAAKYGALSGATGTVDLQWTWASGNQGAVLRVVWKERDGPPVEAAARGGFGTRLIKSVIPGATVRHSSLPEGIECTIEMPLDTHAESP